MTIRVLVQPRPNFFQLQGGDNVQLTKTIEYLRAVDVQVDVSVERGVDLTPYDVVQIYNFGESAGELHYLLNAKRQNKPVVMMPIYWNLERYRRAYAEFTQGWTPPPGSPEISAVIQRREQLRRASVRQAQRILLDQSNLVLPNSKREAELLARDLDAAPDKMRVVYNGVQNLFRNADPKLFVEKYGVRDFVLSVARLSPQKNQLNLVRAWHDEKVSLVLIGNPNEEPRYTAQIKAAAGPNTLFIAHSEHDLIASAYAAAHVHALVSWFEMMPLAALEAGLAGCNLVLTTETAGPEFFGDRVRYVEPDDVPGIRAAIRAALATPRGTDLSAHIHEHFTWDKTATALAAAYHEAMGCGASAPVPESETTYTRLLEEMVLLTEELAADTETLAQYNWSQLGTLTAQLERIEHLPLMQQLRSAKNRLTGRTAP